MVDVVFVTLLVLHVGSIVAWMGGAALFTNIIAPSLGKMSPAARAEFILSAFPKYMRFVGGSAVLAVVAGLLLYGYLMPTGSGAIYLQIGAVVGLIVLGIAFGVMIPSGRKLVSLVGQMSKAQPPSPDSAAVMASLQKRLGMAGRLGVALLGLALVLMVIGAS